MTVLRLAERAHRLKSRYVITRIWHGVVPTDKADEYLDLMQSVALPDYRGTPGNLSSWVLRRGEGTRTDFLCVTQWESLEAIRAFAGPDIQQAKYYDFDPGFLLELEPTVQHFETFGGPADPTS